MLDYYGSITKSSKEVDSELLSIFKNHNQSYITSIISKLRNDNIIQNNYSISGWMVFHKSTIIDHMTEYIQNDTIIAQKKLLLARYCIENDVSFDMIRDR